MTDRRHYRWPWRILHALLTAVLVMHVTTGLLLIAVGDPIGDAVLLLVCTAMVCLAIIETINGGYLFGADKLTREGPTNG